MIAQLPHENTSVNTGRQQSETVRSEGESGDDGAVSSWTDGEASTGNYVDDANALVVATHSNKGARRVDPKFVEFSAVDGVAAHGGLVKFRTHGPADKKMREAEFHELDKIE